MNKRQEAGRPGRRVLAGAVRIAIALGVLALLGSFLGRVHGLGDSLAVFRVPVALAVAAFAAMAFPLGARLASVAGALAALLALATVAPHWLTHAGRAEAAGGAVTVYQKNLWFLLQDPREVVADILDADADIVTLQEVGPGSAPVLDALRATYPVQVRCPYAKVGGVAVLSRLPERPGNRNCAEGLGLVSVDLDTPEGPLRAASVHLHWPWPHRQPGQVAELAGLMRGWDMPAVIGGDFNMVRWSYAMREIGRASGTAPVGPARVTLRNKRLLLNVAIDHVLATGGQGTSSVRPTAGSDHHGLVAGIALPAGQPARP